MSHNLSDEIDTERKRGLACVRCGGSTLGHSWRGRADGHAEHLEACPPLRVLPGTLDRLADGLVAARRTA